MNSNEIKLDFNYMMADFVGQQDGIRVREVDVLGERMLAEDGVHAKLQDMRKQGSLAFADLPYDTEMFSRIQELSERVQERFENFVVLGIGGSALGAMALHQSLASPLYNVLSPQERSGLPRVFFCDNIDPDSFYELLHYLDLSRTVFNVVSKSGQTLETVSQFLIVRDLLQSSLGSDRMKDHIIVTTDPQKGDLRKICNLEEYEGLAVPPGVGGRYSVFSAVGLFPAAVSGINLEGLLAGARLMDLRCRRRSIWENPAYLGAMLHFLADTQHGKCITVMMPYSDFLTCFSAWFCQIHAESLGKGGKGQTPLHAKGATDQHSQLQLFLDGPNNKIFTLLEVDQFKHQEALPPCPREFRDFSSVAYLEKHALFSILHKQQQAIALALAQQKRPNMTIRVPQISPETIGQLLYLYEIQTVVAGFLYELNPFDQPAVELGKERLYHLLGRSGYEKAQPTSFNLEKKSQFII